MSIQDQEPVVDGADEESQVDQELETVEDAQPSDDGENVEVESGADEESQTEAEDESLTDDSGESEVDYQAQIKELREKYEQEHKARAGWDNKYRELLDEHKTLRQQLEEKAAREQELQQAKAAPVWDKRNPAYNEFMAKVPQIELMDRVIREVGDNDEAREKIAAIVGERISNDDIRAYQEFESHKRMVSAKIASGDYSPIMDQVRNEVKDFYSQQQEKQQIEAQSRALLSDPENLKIYQENTEEVTNLITSGVSMDVAFETLRNKFSLSKAEKTLAELKAKEAEFNAKNDLLKKKSEPPAATTQSAAAYDQDALWDKAEAEVRKGNPNASPDVINARFIDLMDEAIAQQR